MGRPVASILFCLVVEIWITFEKSLTKRSNNSDMWSSVCVYQGSHKLVFEENSESLMNVHNLSTVLVRRVHQRIHTLFKLFVSFIFLYFSSFSSLSSCLIPFFCRCLILLSRSHSFCLHYRPPTACTLLPFILTSYPLALRMLIPRALPRSACANEQRR